MNMMDHGGSTAGAAAGHGGLALSLPEHPLPKEILEMQEDETVCRYCGISYLIHSEMKRVLSRCQQLEDSLKAFQEHELERPSLLQRLEKQESDIAECAEKLKSAVQEREESQSRYNILKIAQERVVRKNSELEARVFDLEAEERKLRREIELQKSQQQDEFSRKLSCICEQAAELNRSNSSLRDDVQIRLRSTWESLRGALSIKLIAVLESGEVEKKDLKESYDRQIQSEQDRHRNSQVALCDLEQKLKDEKIQWHAKEQSLQSQLSELQQDNMRLCRELDHRFSEWRQEMQLRENLEKEISDWRGKSEQWRRTEADLSQKILEQEQLIMIKEKEIQDQRAEIEGVRASLLSDSPHQLRSSAYSNASGKTSQELSRMLSEKNAKIYAVEKEKLDLEKKMEEMKMERQQTIDAHHSRIKQLQDHFMEQIKEAGKLEAERAVRETEAVLGERHRLQTEEIRRQISMDHERKIRELIEKHERTNQDLRTRMAENGSSIAMLRDQNAKLAEEMVAIKKSGDAELKKRCEELDLIKVDLAKAAEVIEKQRRDMRDAGGLHALLQAKEIEAGHLREIIRRECEERKELQETLDGLRAGLAMASPSRPLSPRNLLSSHPIRSSSSTSTGFQSASEISSASSASSSSLSIGGNNGRMASTSSSLSSLSSSSPSFTSVALAPSTTSASFLPSIRDPLHQHIHHHPHQNGRSSHVQGRSTSSLSQSTSSLGMHDDGRQSLSSSSEITATKNVEETHQSNMWATKLNRHQRGRTMKNGVFR